MFTPMLPSPKPGPHPQRAESENLVPSFISTCHYNSKKFPHSWRARRSHHSPTLSEMIRFASSFSHIHSIAVSFFFVLRGGAWIRRVQLSSAALKWGRGSRLLYDGSAWLSIRVEHTESMRGSPLQINFCTGTAWKIVLMNAEVGFTYTA